MTKNMTKNERMAWLGELEAPQSGQTALAVLVLLCSCLVLPFSHYEMVATAFMLAVAVFYYLQGNVLRSLLCYGLPAMALYAISAFLPSVVTPLTLPCAYLAIVAGGSCGALLLAHFHTKRLHLLLLAIPAGAYAVAALISGRPFHALLVLLPAVAAAVAGLCLILGLYRTEANVVIAAALAATCVLAGIITLAALGRLQPSFLSVLAEQISDRWLLFFEGFAELSAEAGVAMEIPTVAVTNLAATFINILPALFLCSCAITAFLLWRSLLHLLMAFRSMPAMPLHLVGFSMSKTSAAIFICALVVSLFTSSTETVAGTICINIYLTLLPGLALIGFASLLARGSSASCLSRILLFALILLLFYNPVTALVLVALVGAIGILTVHLLPKQDDNNKGEQ